MSSRSHSSDESDPQETAPGIRMLRNLWNIPKEKPPREQAPKDVPHDIYSVPNARIIPRRYHGQAVKD